MPPVVKLLLILMSVAYPFVVYWGLQSGHQSALVILLAVLLIIRVWSAKKGFERSAALAFVMTILAVMAAFSVSEGLKIYPVVINLSLLFVFASSLFSGMPVIERIARIREANLPASAVTYTRQVTQAWCVFFAVNASISAATVIWADEQTWLLYNGVIAYGLVAVMFSAEWLIRQRVRARAT
jgi:uncharacterized membrane protein